MDYVLFGIQGSGKGTQGKIIAERNNFAFFETGGELRRLAKEDSELGKKVKSIIEAGHLVSNEVVMEIVENFINQIPKEQSVVFDGLPRKIEQADTFDELIKSKDREFTGILINVSKEEALNRLSTRRVCTNCKTVYPATYSEKNCKECGGELITRKDDNPESIKNRLEAFFNETQPVIDRYSEQEKIITINGEQDIEKVTEEIFNKIDFS